MKVTVLSASYGGYDNLAAPPEQDTACDWLMVTDRPATCPPWQVKVERRPLMHPRLAAKVPKVRPDLYTDADVTIWIDANMRITSPHFVSWCLEHLGDADFAFTPHQWAANLEAELDLALPLPKYAGLPMREQVASYVAADFPLDYGNWWTGLIVRRRHLGLNLLGDAWLREMCRWTYEDQLSLPYVLWRQAMRPAPLPVGWPHLFGWADHNAEASWGPR